MRARGCSGRKDDRRSLETRFPRPARTARGRSGNPADFRKRAGRVTNVLTVEPTASRWRLAARAGWLHGGAGMPTTCAAALFYGRPPACVPPARNRRSPCGALETRFPRPATHPLANWGQATGIHIQGWRHGPDSPWLRACRIGSPCALERLETWFPELDGHRQEVACGLPSSLGCIGPGNFAGCGVNSATAFSRFSRHPCETGNQVSKPAAGDWQISSDFRLSPAAARERGSAHPASQRATCITPSCPRRRGDVL